jgi:hypothetical protein
MRGTSVDYLRKRLAAIGRDDLLAAIDGNQVSTYAAACEAGLIRRRPIFGGGSTNASKRRAFAFRAIRGDGYNPPLSREQLRAWWLATREGMLARCAPGRRPWPWYIFDGWDGPPPSRELERSTLWRLGLLTEQEQVELEAWWRAEFDRAWVPDFMVPRAWPEEPLEGAGARDAHCRWADIPHELIQRWTQEVEGAA